MNDDAQLPTPMTATRTLPIPTASL